MKIKLRSDASRNEHGASFSLDAKLASYLAASASLGTVLASEANAIVISNPTVQNVGINGFANIDFNSDGQTDFQIDHDRVDLTPQGGPVVDYLQLDKNDVNGASPGENLLQFDANINCCFQATTFPPNGTTPNDQNNAAYMVADDPMGGNGPVEYPSALLASSEIGPVQNQNKLFDFQEGDNVYGKGKTGRMNRLIDEDHGQADVLLGGKSPGDILVPGNTPQFLGVQNQVRYVGVRMELNNSGQFNYGWIGVKITNEADATGQVVGYGYESTPETAILAGTTGARAGDYNNDGKVDAADYILWRKGGTLQNETATPGTVTAEDYTAWRLNFGGTPTSGSGLSSGAVPEPGSMLLSLSCGLGLIGSYLFRRVRGK